MQAPIYSNLLRPPRPNGLEALSSEAPLTRRANDLIGRTN